MALAESCQVFQFRLYGPLGNPDGILTIEAKDSIHARTRAVDWLINNGKPEHYFKEQP